MPLNNPFGGLGCWAVEHDDEMRRLAACGTSYRAIALTLNAKFGTHYSKSAVIGRASRVGLTKKPASSAALSGPTKKKEFKRIITFGNANATRVYSTVQREQYKVRCVEIEPRHVSLMDLEPGDCRYPYGDETITFCGHPKQAESSYCTAHYFLCNEAPRIPIRRFAGVAA
jgi:GcrA cell cycle regulator